MSNMFELKSVINSSASDQLAKKTLRQLMHEIAHYGTIYGVNKSLSGRRVLRFQIQKLKKVIRDFPARNLVA